MRSEVEQQLPKINFSGLVVGTPAWDAARAQVMDALDTHGCFELVHDEHLNPKLRDQVFNKALTDWFALPTDVKSRSTTYVNKLYVKSAQTVTISDGKPEITIPTFTTLMWPHGNPHFCETMQRYTEIMKELDQMVQRMIMEGLGVDKYCDEMFQNTMYALNASYYESDMEHDIDHEVYMGAHSDPGLVTIIGQDEAQGLEVLIKTSQSWFRPAPFSYIVFPSDAMEGWTNGRVKAMSHRVIKEENNGTRYVTLSTSLGAKGFTLKTPAELIDEAHPALYKPFDNNEYFEFYRTPRPRDTTGTALESFCGIKNII